MNTVDLQGQALNLMELIYATERRTQSFYISVFDEMYFMEAVYGLVRKLPFMIQMRKAGEYCFNFQGKRYTVSVDLTLPQGELHCHELKVVGFRGVNSQLFMYYGDPELRVEIPRI